MTTARDDERDPDTGTAGTPTEGAAVPSSPVARPTGSAGGSGRLVFDDPLDRPSPDDADRGWGESPSGAGDDDFTRFLNEKPPHHL